MIRTNNHHMLFNRRSWELYPETKRLREDMGLIAHMDVGTHNELHANIDNIPLPTLHMASVALNYLRRLPDRTNPLECADHFMFGIQEACQSPRSNELDRMLGQLVISSVYAQKPYVEEGMMKAKVIDLGGLGFRGR